MRLSPSDYAAPSLQDDTEPAEEEQSRTPAATPAPAGQQPDLKKLVAFTADHFGVDADVLAGMIMRESMLRPDVISGQRKSTAGAVGIAQFMPGTAERYGIDPTDVTQSVIGMGAYLRDNLKKFDGDYDRAIAGYNWGENRSALDTNDWRERAPQETRDYVDFVRQFADQLKAGRAPSEGVSTNAAGMTPQQLEAAANKQPSTPGLLDRAMDAVAPVFAASPGDAPRAPGEARRGTARGTPFVAGDDRILGAGAGRGTINPPLVGEGRRAGESVLDMAARPPQGGAEFVPLPDSADRERAALIEQSLAPAERERRERELRLMKGTGEAMATPPPSVAGEFLHKFDRRPFDQSLVGAAVETAGDAARGLAKVGPGLAAAGYGAIEVGADVVGARRVADWASSSSQAGREYLAQFNNPNGDHLVTGAFQSLGTALAGGAAGGAGLATGLMVGQTAGDKYAELRAAKVDVDAALEGAAVHGVAEYLGERVGMKNLGEMVEGIASKSGLSLRQALGHALVQQGEEQVTLGIQSLYDKLGRGSLRNDMTRDQYLDEMVDTIKQTAIMTAAAGGGGAIARTTGLAPAPVAPQKSAMEIAKEKGFLVDRVRAAQASGLTSFTPADSDSAKAGLTPIVVPTVATQPQAEVPVVEAAGKEKEVLDGVQSALAGLARDRGAPAEGAAGAGLGDVGPVAAEQPAADPQSGVPAASAASGRSDPAGSAPTGRDGVDAALSEEPAVQWRGRRGGGYANIMDAEQALPGVQKRHPDLDWRIERDADDAALQLNGYRRAAAEPATQNPELDARANEAATSPANDLPEPTQAQKEAGNYKVGRITIGGLNISVENPRGSQRSGVDKDGSPWSVTMANHYGYIRGTTGADKDHVDVIVGPSASDKAFVVDQIHPSDGKFDEHKVVLGASNLEDAKAIYQANYAPGWKGMGGITEMPMSQFKVWVKAGAKTRPLTDLKGVANEEVARAPAGWGEVPSGVEGRDDVPAAGALPATESAAAPVAPPAGLTEKDVQFTLTSIQDTYLKRRGEPVRLTPMADGASADTDAAKSLAEVFGKPIIFAHLHKKPGAAGFSAVNTPKAFVITDDTMDAHVALTMHEALHAMDDDVKSSLIEALKPVLKREAHEADFPHYRDDIRDEEIVASLAQQHSKTPEFWNRLADKMGDGQFAKFARGLIAKLDEIVGRFKDRNLTKYATDVEKVREALATAYAETLKRRGVAVDAEGVEFASVPRSSREIMVDPDKFKQTYKLQPKTNSTRAIGEALNEHTIKTHGKIEDSDTSTQARDQIAQAIADEVEHQLSAEAKGAKTGTGVGWYSKNYPKALTSLGKLYPELQKSKGARSTFTALLAITSNGEKVGRNIAMARQLYETYRQGGDMMKAIPGTKRQQSLDQNVEAVAKLLETYGPTGMAKVLLEEMRVGDINAELRKAGVQTNSAYPANMVMPRAALFFGPKLGAFYANLMGSQGYLTMDLWWSRSFNRMRGTLLPEPTDGAVAALREAFGEPEADVSRLIELARPYQEAYAAKGYKDGTSLEKRANTFMKAAALELNEAPARASDREFMAATAQKAQQLLRTKGIDLTIADVQAALWYYEKRLYGALGSRIVGDIGYLEAIRNAANEGDRSAGSPARGDRAGSSDDRGQATDVSAEDQAIEFSDNERSFAQRLRDGGGARGSDATVALDSRPQQGSRGSDLRGLAAEVRVDGELIRFGGFKPAQDAARAYAQKAGIDYQPPRDYVTVDKERAGRIAQAFEAMPHDPSDKDVKASYEAMVKETLAQYQAILDTGLKVEFITGDDPYRNPRNAILDVTMNNHLWVFPTVDGFGGPASSDVDISGNPLLAPTPHAISGRVALVNDIFRVVHDYFGHIKEGVGFRADGEENAWRAHAAMYSPLARRAMTTETRGQNSWVNYGPHSASNKTAGPADTEYAPQKIGLLPEWVSEDGRGDTEFADNPQTQTAAFKKWFGDSKVVDADGKPLVVYHGTRADVKQFDINAPRNMAAFRDAQGFYFTRYAEDAANYSYEDIDADKIDGANVMPVYLSMQNPLRVDTADTDNHPAYISAKRRAKLEADGYDGVILGDGVELVVFKSEQIKSAIGNRGTFDAEDARIDFADNRADWAWTAVDTPNGPIYAGRNYALVKPTRLAVDDFVEDDEVALPMGHASFVTEGNTPYGWQIVDRNGEVVGIMQAQVTPDGEIEAIHDIAIDRRGAGIGREIVAHIAAARRGDVRIIEALPQSQGFWDKVGAGYYDTNRNTTLDWETFSRGAAGQATAQARREEAEPAGAIPAGEAGELSAEEVKRLGIEFAETPAFKRWFADSKVVDEAGKPLVVYHGTAADFGAFDKSRLGENTKHSTATLGFFFSADPSVSDIFNSTLNESEWPRRAKHVDGANTMPVYLSIANPRVMTAAMFRDLAALGGRTGSKAFAQFAKDLREPGIARRLLGDKHDGILVKGDPKLADTLGGDEWKADTWIAFRPEQIKSAIGNRGTFDGADPRINFAFDLESIKRPDPKPATRATDGWILSRDELGNFRFGAGQKLYNVVAHIANKVAARFEFKPMSPELRRAIRQMKLEVAKSQGKTAEVAKAMTEMSKEHRELISDIIEGELKAGVTPPKQVLDIAASISALMSQQSDDLIAVGMLSKEAADKWRDRYLPRFYESKLREKATAKWDAAVSALMRKPTVLKGIGGKSLKRRGMVEVIDVADLPSYLAMGWTVDDPTYQAGVHTRVSVHRDFTREERENMGEIRDSMFRFVMGYSRSQKDLALGRLYEHLADTIASRHPLEGYTQVPDTRIDGTDVSTYGKLSGLYVPNDVLSHLTQFGESEHEAVLKIYRKVLGMWKEGKTVLNPVSHVNNVISNLTMAHFGGVSYWDGHKYLATMKDFITGGGLLEQAREAGLFGGTVSEAELMNMMPKELQIIAKTTESRAAKNVDFVWSALSLFLRKPMGVAYNAEDVFFRHLLFREAKSRGLHDNDAVDYAQKYIFTYDDLPRGVRFMRDTALPFFSYTYKVIPVMAHTALAHPWRYAAPWAVLTAVNTLMYAIAAGQGDDEDWKDSIKRYVTDAKFRDEVRDKEKMERANLPPWMKGSGFMLGTPKTIRLGKDDLTQLPVFLDVSRFFPGGDLLDAHTNTGGVPMLAPLTPSNPLLSTMGAMLWNRDPYFGKDVVDSNDTNGEAATKRGQWLWQQFAPAIAVNGYHFNRAMNAVAQATGKTITWWPEDFTGVGKDGLPIQPQYAAMQTVGIKVRPIDLDAAAQIDAGQRKKLISEIDAEVRKIRRLQARGAISAEQAEVKSDEARLKKERLRQGLTVDGGERE